MSFKRIGFDSGYISKIQSNLSEIVGSLSSEGFSLFGDKMKFENAESYNVFESAPNIPHDFDSFMINNNQSSYENVSRGDFFKAFSYNGYIGVLQGAFHSGKYETTLFGEYYDTRNLQKGKQGELVYTMPNEESQRLQYFLMEKYNLSKRESAYCMDIVDSLGACAYSAVATAIMYEFKDKPEEFEEIMGFPYYTTIDGERQLNGDQLMLDMYIYANSLENGGWMFDKTGQAFKEVIDIGFVKIDEPKPWNFYTIPEEKVVIYNENGDVSLYTDIQEYRKTARTVKQHAIMSDKEGVTYLNYNTQNGFKDKITIERVFHYDFDSENNNQFEIENIVTDSKTRLENGEQLVISLFGSPSNPIHIDKADSDYSSYFEDEFAWHTMYVIDVLEDSFLVLSWGEEYEIPFDQITEASRVYIEAIDSK